MTEISEKKSTSLSSTDVSSDGPEATDNTNSDFDCLSDEILLKILQFLNIRSLCRCSQVNKRLERVVRDPFLYTTLNLDPYWEIVTDNVLEHLAPRCQLLRRLVLSNCGGNGRINPGLFKNFLDVCGHSLTYLNLCYAHFVDDSIVEKISSICRNLKYLDLYSNKVTDNGFQYLTALNSLEGLEIFFGAIETQTLIRILQRNPKIKLLSLSHVHSIDIDAVAATIPCLCPDLESLDLGRSTISSRGIKELAKCVNLRKLNMNSCSNMFYNDDTLDPENGLKTLFAGCVRLESVNLQAVRYFTDEDLEPLLLCPIKELNLSGAENLTADMCSRCLSSWPKLRRIVLRQCQNISDNDVREWQERYPRVSIDYARYDRRKFGVCRR